MVEEKPQLFYFGIPGRAEGTKMLFKEAKVDYEFVDVGPKWGDMKKEFEFGQVPAVKIDGKTLVQTKAIMTYLGVKYGFYPADAQGAYEVMWWFGGMGDCEVPFGKWYMEKDSDKKKEIAADICANHMTKFLAIFEKKLASKANKDFLVGDKFTIADFAFVGFFRYVNHVEDFKPLQAEMEKFPVIKAFLEKYNKYFFE